MLFKLFELFLLSFLLLFGLISGAEAAGGPDYTSVTSSVDFTAVGTGILAVAAAIALALVVRKGAKMLIGMIR